MRWVRVTHFLNIKKTLINDNILIRILLIIPYLLPSIPISKPKKRVYVFSLSLSLSLSSIIHVFLYSLFLLHHSNPSKMQLKFWKAELKKEKWHMRIKICKIFSSLKWEKGYMKSYWGSHFKHKRPRPEINLTSLWWKIEKKVKKKEKKKGFDAVNGIKKISVQFLFSLQGFCT